MSFVGRSLLRHFILNISVLLFLMLVHLLPCQLFSTFHMFFQFKSELLGSIVLWFNTGLMLFKFAHVLSYIVVIVRLTKDLNAVSIIFSFQIVNILILLVVTS